MCGNGCAELGEHDRSGDAVVGGDSQGVSGAVVKPGQDLGVKPGASVGAGEFKGALGVAAMSAARSKNTYLAVKYRRIASRRGPMKAIVAVEHAMLLAIWNMTTTGALSDDPGPDFYNRRNPDKAKRRAIEQLRVMGYTVDGTQSRRSQQLFPYARGPGYGNNPRKNARNNPCRSGPIDSSCEPARRLKSSAEAMS